MEPYYPDTPTARADITRHYNNIALLDQEIGELLDQLEKDGLADNTIVIWATDHGDGLPRAKRELYDSGLKVPMVIRWPEKYRPADVTPGALDERLISFVDLAPTILSLAGVPVPATMHGSSFVADDAVPREYVYASRDRIDEVMDRQRAVRDARFKYLRSWYPGQPGGHRLKFRDNIDMAREMRTMYDAGTLNKVQSLWYEPPGEERLYDLKQDPFEVKDVSTNPQYHHVMQRMRAEMNTWLTRADDWSEEPEDKMVARFQPGGKRQVTPVPTLSVTSGTLIVTPAAADHSLEYRVANGRWQLYTGPVKLSITGSVDARAVRYGWEESEIVSSP
jgi:arylsulfatase A-like enzyme